MRSHLVAFVLPALSLACCGNPKPREITIRPGSVDLAAGNQADLTGKFYTGPADPGEQTRISTGTGGACLLAQVQQKMCQRAEDCEIQFQISPVGLRTWGGYCLDRKMVGDAGVIGQCWVKPSESFCVKHPSDPWPDGDHDVPATPVERTQFYKDANRLFPDTKQGIKWRVAACLNVYDDKLKRDALNCAGLEKGPKPPLNPAGKPSLPIP